MLLKLEDQAPGVHLQLLQEAHRSFLAPEIVCGGSDENDAFLQKRKEYMAFFLSCMQVDNVLKVINAARNNKDQKHTNELL